MNQTSNRLELTNWENIYKELTMKSEFPPVDYLIKGSH